MELWYESTDVRARLFCTHKAFLTSIARQYLQKCVKFVLRIVYIYKFLLFSLSLSLSIILSRSCSDRSNDESICNTIGLFAHELCETKKHCKREFCITVTIMVCKLGYITNPVIIAIIKNRIFLFTFVRT